MMPSGVEHLMPQCFPKIVEVAFALMPSGVEHPVYEDDGEKDTIEVAFALMPSGVEH